jgi:hypothetical protein
MGEECMSKGIVITVWMCLVLCVGATAQSQAPVAIEGVYPDSGMPGTVVVIRGHGFALGDQKMIWAANLAETMPTPGFVEFNGLRGEVQLWQDNLVVVAVPDGATSGPVRVTLRSGLSVGGNNFEVVNAEGESEGQAGRKDYSFQEREGVDMWDDMAFNRPGGLIPSPYYFYYGYHPSTYNRAGWDLGGTNRDDFWDFFLVSGPIFSTCGLWTGLDHVRFFPGRFNHDFQNRWNWWNNTMVPSHGKSGQKGKRSYSFQEH